MNSYLQQPQMQPPRPRRLRGRRGVVLAVAMWLLVILLILALGLAYDTQISTKSVGNTNERANSYYAAYSAIERVCAELESGQVQYTAPAGTGDGTAGTWQYIDSDQEPLAPNADEVRYMAITEDNCAKLDLNQADENGLSKIPELNADQVQAILTYRGTASQTGAQPQTTTPGNSAANTASTGATFKSVDELMLLQNFTPDLLYGAATWQERLSPAERFRSDWAQLQGGQQNQAQPQTTNPQNGGSTGVLLSERFAVGARARRLGSDGQPRVTLATITRQELQDRLDAIADTLQINSTATSGGQAGPGGRGGGGGGRRTASPAQAALNILSNRGVRNWSQVWGLVNNNRDAVRLLADVITLPNDGGGGGNVNANDGGPGGGGPGGRPGGGPGGGGPGGGRPGGPGGGPGGGRGPGGGGPGGGGPGGGGPGGGFPGGGPGGGFPGGGPGGGGPGGRGASSRLQRVTPTLALYRPGVDRYAVQLAQAPGGGQGGANPGGGNAGRGGAGGGRGGAGGGATGGAGTGSTSSAAGDAAASQPMEGAINLNTAAPEVLSTLPNMTDEVVQAIVDARSQAPLVSRGDLLKIDQVNQTIFNAIVEKVTVISDSFTIRALGMNKKVSPGSGRINDLAVHLTATIDRTTGRCRIVRLRQDN